MCKKKSQRSKIIPAVVIAAIIFISGGFKVLGNHPMMQHFVEMGFSRPMVSMLGICEMVFSLLFVFGHTSKIGLLLLTAYLGGAMAAEIPYHQLAAPFVPLVLVWITAFIRQRSLFFQNSKSNNSVKHSTINR
jgi:hypothetical protein